MRITLDNQLESILRGRFDPEQYSIKIFDTNYEENSSYLVFFHERYHHFQNIFSPYGHMKWSIDRDNSNQIIKKWVELTNDLDVKKIVPISAYLSEENIDSIKVLYNMYFYYLSIRLQLIAEGKSIAESDLKLMGYNYEDIIPKITINENQYELNGIDVIESCAKFQEAMLAYTFERIDINEIISPDKLDERYYIALYYFIENLGMDRINEFPIVCELSLAFSELILPDNLKRLYKNHIAWRFIKIIDFLKEHHLKLKDFSEKSFLDYTNTILEGCNYDTWDILWNKWQKYENNCDLKFSTEMSKLIDYKKSHLWILSYPLFYLNEIINNALLSPHYIILEQGVFYNGNLIDEIFFENNFKALSNQIIGIDSKYRQYPCSLMCADQYYGLKQCKYFLNGDCDGHVDYSTQFPMLELDNDDNIINGCEFEVVLKLCDIDLNEIVVKSFNTKYCFDDIIKRYKDLSEK